MRTLKNLLKGCKLPENLDLALLISVFGVTPEGKIEGRTRIQKIICLLQSKENLPFSFNYKPYYYGPYSDDLSEGINTLVGMKLLDEKIVPTRRGSYRYDYKLTDEGIKIFEKIQQKNEKVIKFLSENVTHYSSLNTPHLVNLAKKISGIPSITQ